MKFLIMILFSLITICCSESPAEKQLTAASKERIQDEVLKSLEKFSHAFATANVAELENLITHDYVHTNTNGSVVTRSTWLDWNRSRQELIREGKLRITTFENSNIKIKVLTSDICIVTGANITAGEREGRPFSNKIRFTHVWENDRGVWKRSVFHDSRIDADN